MDQQINNRYVPTYHFHNIPSSKYTTSSIKAYIPNDMSHPQITFTYAFDTPLSDACNTLTYTYDVIDL